MPPPEEPIRALRAERHSGQRPGSLVKPFWAKNSCSPAVKVNSRLHSRHIRGLSAKLTTVSSRLVCWVKAEASRAGERCSSPSAGASGFDRVFAARGVTFPLRVLYPRVPGCAIPLARHSGASIGPKSVRFSTPCRTASIILAGAHGPLREAMSKPGDLPEELRKQIDEALAEGHADKLPSGPPPR